MRHQSLNNLPEIKQLGNVSAGAACDSTGCAFISCTLLVALEHVFCQRPFFHKPRSNLRDRLPLWNPYEVDEKEEVVFWGEELQVWMPGTSSD